MCKKPRMPAMPEMPAARAPERAPDRAPLLAAGQQTVATQIGAQNPNARIMDNNAVRASPKLQAFAAFRNFITSGAMMRGSSAPSGGSGILGG